MIKVQNELTGVVQEFETIYDAARELGGMTIKKDDASCLRRLRRHGWKLTTSDATTALSDGIAQLIREAIKVSGGNPSSMDAESFTELVNQVEKLKFEVEQTNVILNCDKDNLQEVIKRQDKTETILDAVCKKLDARKVDEIVIKKEGKKPIHIKGQHKQFGTLLRILTARLNALLIGPAGSGKTTAAEKVAETLGLKYYSVSVGAQTTTTAFFGYTDAHGKYNRTLFREAYENGGVFLIDEMDAGNANVLVSINQALANSSCAFPDNKMVTKHPDFVIIASANTWGSGASREYVGRNQLDAATKDRFIPLLWDYDFELEEALTSNKIWLAEVRRVRAAVEKHGIRQIISPRASLYGSKLLDTGLEFDEVKKMVLLKDMNETDIKLVEQFKA